MGNKFEELKNYFLNLGLDDVLIKSNRHSFIDTSWIFTNLIDREVIKRAIASIMKENNDKYEEQCRYLGKDPNNIEGFEIIRDNGRLIFQAQGADNLSKLNITDQILEKDQKIKTITYSQLRDEIMKVLNNKELDEANSKLVLAGINTAFDQACGNLLDYYKYLLEQRKENSKHLCVINQKKDEGESRTKKGEKAHPRTSDLIAYSKREKMLKKLNPDAEIDVKEVDEDVYDAYTAFVYHNDLLKDINEEKEGRLFICEPIGGDRLTRIFYLTDEEFEQFKIEKGNDKLAEIVKHFLDMSNDEFRKQHGTVIMNHTNFESYAERINFFLRGSKGKSLTNLKKYTKYIRKLYKDPEIELPYYKPKTGEDLGIAGSSVSSIDRTAQQAIKDNTKQNEEVK